MRAKRMSLWVASLGLGLAMGACTSEEGPSAGAAGFGTAGAGQGGSVGGQGGAEAGLGGAGGGQAGSGGGQSGAGGAQAGSGGSEQDAAAEGGETYDAQADAAWKCEPAPEPGTFYALSAEGKLEAEPISMCKYRGKVVLLANVAAKCGFTPQMGSLAAVQTTYKDQGLVVLGFYSDQFGQQAGSEEEQATCEQNYGVNFELFEPVNVNPPQEHEIFTWLKAQPGGAGAIDWNFEKFLLSRKGALLGRWASAVDPESDTLTTAIEAALSASP